MALLLDTKSKIIGYHELSVGTIDASLVDPAALFRAAVLAVASSVVLVHNHPSGDPTPSREDLQITKQLINAGHLIGVTVLDHVIIGDPGFHSIRESGVLSFKS